MMGNPIALLGLLAIAIPVVIHLLARHHSFANSVALFQVAIALGAVAALTRVSIVWWGSILTGLSGIALFLQAFLR